ncbi:hypothetical protein [Geminicoccus roseus]|uniref:hypothetical protein n=1 Tax=Geminicoccus roseus TaxID=404900 RepID=UPI0012F785D6|nr:hypothetical protein [Geminicoccus roseus]
MAQALHERPRAGHDLGRFHDQGFHLGHLPRPLVGAWRAGLRPAVGRPHLGSAALLPIGRLRAFLAQWHHLDLSRVGGEWSAPAGKSVR